jgi:IclR family KDG regulon transcriptional repressor
MANKTFSPVKSADRVFDILEELLKHSEGIQLRELGKKLRIADSSIHALVNTMLHRKYIRMDENRKLYLGNKLYAFAAPLSSPLIGLVKPFMKEIKTRFNENVHLAILDGPDVMYIAYEESSHPIRYVMEIGRVQPAYVTGVGKMLLSALTDRQIVEMYDNYHFEKFTANTITTVEHLIQKLQQIRQDGYSVDDFESYEGTKCFAAPIYNNDDTMIASLSISIPQVRFGENRDEEFIRVIKDTTKKISSLLKE